MPRPAFAGLLSGSQTSGAVSVGGNLPLFRGRRVGLRDFHSKQPPDLAAQLVPVGPGYHVGVDRKCRRRVGMPAHPAASRWRLAQYPELIEESWVDVDGADASLRLCVACVEARFAQVDVLVVELAELANPGGRLARAWR